MDALPCSTIVYRAITRSADFQAGRPLANAFLRRKSDLKGLSVNFNVKVPEECAPHLTGKRAIVSLHVGCLRDSGLDAIPDSLTHANVDGLPFSGDDPLRAEQFAAILVSQCRVAWVKPTT